MTPTADERRERVRLAIVDRGLEHAIAGRMRDGSGKPKALTWGEVFAKAYGRELVHP